MHKIVTIVLIAACIWNSKAGIVDEGSLNRIKRDDGDSSGLNIQFQIPDLVTPYIQGADEIQLEAYRVRGKDEWASIGQPYFIKDEKGTIYTFSPESIYFEIRLLSDDQKKALQAEAKRRNPTMPSPMITLIPLQSMICSVRFILDRQEYILQGTAVDFNRLNAFVNMPYAEDNPNRKAFIERINRPDLDPLWLCTFQAAGKELQTNQIKITSSQMSDVALEGQLFGKGSEAFVTRNQMNQLSQTLHQRLAIDEQYEIAGDDFDQKLYDKLLDLATAPFQQVPIDQALAMLSKFGATQDQRDISPSIIKKEMSNVLQVDKQGSKSYISLTNDTKRAGTEREKDGVDTEVSAKVKVPLIVDVETKTAVKVANERGGTWNNSDLNLDQQLKELNSETTNHVQWAIDGDRVIPKSMNVAKVSKSKMQTDINISYKKTYIQNAQYRKTAVVLTTDFVPLSIARETKKARVAFNKMDQQVTKFSQKLEGLIHKFSSFVNHTSAAINTLKHDLNNLPG